MRDTVITSANRNPPPIEEDTGYWVWKRTVALTQLRKAADALARIDARLAKMEQRPARLDDRARKAAP